MILNIKRNNKSEYLLLPKSCIFTVLKSTDAQERTMPKSPFDVAYESTTCV